MKDKRRWTLSKTFNDFNSLKMAFPIFTTWFFTSRFPLPTLDIFLMSSQESLERRRRMLEEWMRELVLNEMCMSNPVVLNAIYEFIEADSHGGRCTIENVMKQQKDASITSRIQSPHVRHTNRMLSNCFPLKLVDCISRLPYRVNCREFAELQTAHKQLFVSEGAAGDSIDQLKKDLRRDRLIIQGKRFLGSKTTYEDLNNFCVEVFQEIVNQRLNQGSSSSSSSSSCCSSSSSRRSSLQNREEISTFCTNNLRYASRTESAYIAHQLLLACVETMTPDATPLLVVPESMLSEPLILNFRLMEKDGDDSKWCIACDVEAAACFRLVTADEAMDVALQLKVTYCKTMYALDGGSSSSTPSSTPSTPSTAPSTGNCALIEKEGACFVVFDKETLTTKRDWKK
jgi:hypothetical protein